MPSYTFTVNGETTTVEAAADLAMLWVLRDKLGITGPMYGCASTSAKPAPATSTAKPSTRASPSEK